MSLADCALPVIPITSVKDKHEGDRRKFSLFWSKVSRRERCESCTWHPVSFHVRLDALFAQHRYYADMEGRFFPQKENLLAADPIGATRLSRDQIESMQEIGQDDTHLCPGKTGLSSVSLMKIDINLNRGATYFLPMQSRAPTLKGLNADLSSWLNSAGGGSSQRSGRNSVDR